MFRLAAFIATLLANLPFVAAGNAETARTLSPSPLSAVSLLQTILALLLVLGCIVLVAWLLRRSSSFHSSAGGKLKIIAAVGLGPRERAVVLQVGDKQLLLGVTPQQIHTLHVLDAPLSAENSTAPQGDFASRLRQFMRQGGDD